MSFMHRSFCAAGLPLRRPKNVLDPYARNDGRFSLTISPQRLMLPDGGWCDIGVPWGPKGRLLIVWATSQALDPSRRVGDRWLEIGRIDEWLSEVGIAPNARSRTETKDMIFRLAFSQFTMIMKQSGSTFFKSDRMFERGAFHDNSLTDYASGNLNRSPLDWNCRRSLMSGSRQTAFRYRLQGWRRSATMPWPLTCSSTFATACRSSGLVTARC